MTVCYRVLILLAASLSMRADLTIKVRTIGDAGSVTESTEYYKGDFMRRDFGDSYQVIDFSTGRSFSVDSSKKEFYPFVGSKLAVTRVVDPSHIISVEVTSSATGEQREWFGYVARRYVTTKRSNEEFNGKSSGVRETHTDSWVLDLPLPPHVQGIANPNASFFLAVGAAGGVMKVPDMKVTQRGPVPHGLVVWLKSDHYETEVVELSLAPLEESLFQAPKGFSEVTSPAFEARPRSWSEQIALEWLRFRVWLENVLFYKG
jgi:hypothetical protein